LTHREALEYAIHNQSDKRNLTDGDIIRLVEVLDKGKKREEGQAEPSKWGILPADGTKDYRLFSPLPIVPLSYKVYNLEPLGKEVGIYAFRYP
jgi:hypothetical protein